MRTQVIMEAFLPLRTCARSRRQSHGSNHPFRQHHAVIRPTAHKARARLEPCNTESVAVHTRASYAATSAADPPTVDRLSQRAQASSPVAATPVTAHTHTHCHQPPVQTTDPSLR